MLENDIINIEIKGDLYQMVSTAIDRAKASQKRTWDKISFKNWQGVNCRVNSVFSVVEREFAVLVKQIFN